jgi:alkanesulfonate monooxygenase SsuD/methylene tetrahydromethanopterin reductase-like flavin-dependent oxidoreductase (luciferase family)
VTGLRFGILPTPIYGAETPYRRQLDEHVELVRTAEELGFSLMSCGQHFVGTELRYYQPVPYLGYLAQQAPTMRALIGIALLSMVNPVETAESVATLDVVTDGRVVFGAALGYSEREFRAMGVDPKQKISRFEDGLRVVRAMWSGTEVNVVGKHYAVAGVLPSVRPVRPGGPPVWIGGQSTPAIRRAARLGDAWYAPPFPSHDELRALRREYLTVREELDLSTDGDFPVRRELIVAGSRDEARRIALERSESRYRTYRRWGLSGENQPTTGERDGIDVESQFILGSPAEVVDQLGRLRAELGMTDFLFKAHWQGVPHADAMKQLELFGTRVVPQLL